MTRLLGDWLVDPLGLLFLWSLVLGTALLLRGAGRTRRGRRRSATARRLGPLALLCWCAGVAFVSAPAVVDRLVARLESRVPPGDCAGELPIVMLGGGVDSRATSADDFAYATPMTLARTMATAERARRYPGARVIVSGGNPHGTGADHGTAEADVVGDFLVSTGIDPARIERERFARDTLGNAAEVAKLVSPATGGTTDFALVTTAMHMPRAVGAFRALGLEPCPVPVDHRALERVPSWALWPQSTALAKFDYWLHETVGMQVYRWRGVVADEAPARPVVPAPS